MAHELIYTSAHKGLQPGTRGFCTVAHTRGMRSETVRLLESISAYKNLYSGLDARAGLNPPSISHHHFTLGGLAMSVLSRVAPALADHTQRSNKIAHHVVLRRRERSSVGPAWVCARDGFFVESWADEPALLEMPKEIPDGEQGDLRATTWESLTGDAGWAGTLAYTILSRPNTPSILLFEPGMDMMALVSEALSLIEPEQRWEVTFNTYFTSLPAGASCAIRCCVADTDGLREARRNMRSLVIDLTKPLGPPPSENALVECARTGEPVSTKPRRAAARPGSTFVRLPPRNRTSLRMRPEGPEGRRRNDTGTGTGRTHS
ncbi:MAG: hypothetical protein HN742_42180 [Lentisphaerae bacterium]|nr:hypothetical protein [Lentisphaerota bacterium]MBT4820385.1 hypothetical protein [Lentisphaerota bacterium]MBT5605913.1 hypothetical protein [Lentisphaerota bacterium]MBT7057992.1 hypothetical protein [Lentisphaerota bacterium]MBT7848547.1 hypothetical protein [Lentisphaerota bacterium]